MIIIVIPFLLAALSAVLMWCLFRRSTSWRIDELALPLVSPVAWILLWVLAKQPTKSLSNFFAENLWLTLLPITYGFVRSFGFRGRVSPQSYAIICAGFLAITLLVFFMTPTLPE